MCLTLSVRLGFHREHYMGCHFEHRVVLAFSTMIKFDSSLVIRVWLNQSKSETYSVYSCAHPSPSLLFLSRHLFFVQRWGI